MNRNKIKIICHAQAKTLSYQFQNEQMAWVPVSQFSDLAQRKFTMTSIRQSAPEILNVINTIYNPGNRGVDISFEGPDQDYNYLCKIVDEKFSNDNISCGQQTIKAAIAGKCGVGKTTLIEALAQKEGIHYTVVTEDKYTHYKGKANSIEWYELGGIDLGLDSMKKAQSTIDELAEHGLTLFVYCLRTSRVEQPEVQLIQHIREHHPEVSILGILTNALSMDEFASAEKIGRQLNIKVFPVMAKDQKTRGGVVKAFGLENVLSAIYGGN